MSITIGPVHIADVDGTHEPGAVIETPSAALVELANAKTVHPETGLPYATRTVEATSAPAPKPAPAPSAPSTPASENA